MKLHKIWMVAIMAMAFNVSAMGAYAGSLDGKSFTGNTGKMGKKSSNTDVITFENGKFSSSGCQEYGFGSGTYQATTEGEKTHFVADTFSEKTGRITWVGTISGDKLDATYIWYKKGKYSEPKQIKWFKGNMNK